MKRRTLRGQVREGEVKRLIVDDGRMTSGYRVLSFQVAPRNPADASADVFGTLSLDYDTPLTWDFQDNRQIAWSSLNIQSPSGASSPFTLIDPDHIVIMDLYVQGQLGLTSTNELVNYFVVIEPVEITEEQAILALIKERSQDDLR